MLRPVFSFMRDIMLARYHCLTTGKTLYTCGGLLSPGRRWKRVRLPNV